MRKNDDKEIINTSLKSLKRLLNIHQVLLTIGNVEIFNLINFQT